MKPNIPKPARIIWADGWLSNPANQVIVLALLVVGLCLAGGTIFVIRQNVAALAAAGTAQAKTQAAALTFAYLSATPTFTSTPTPTQTSTPTETPLPSSTPTPRPTHTPTETPVPSLTPTREPGSGKIVFTCQVTRSQSENQICLMNADGSNLRQLTNNSADNFYPSLAPDGEAIVFSSNQDGEYSIYEMDLDGNQHRINTSLSEAYAPEISPNGSQIVFTNVANGAASAIWVMDRDGGNPYEAFRHPTAGYQCLDPVWAGDNSHLLFACGSDGKAQKQLYYYALGSSVAEQIGNLQDLRGRSDWSHDSRYIATYLGLPWHREIYLMNTDGSNLTLIGRTGSNSLAPSFSPDSLYIAFTSYMDNYGDDNGCEIYTMQIDGSQIRRLTSNNYCDWQPRWGP